MQIIFFLALSSCINNDIAEDFVVYPDVYLVKKIINNEPAYAVAFYAYGNQLLRNASVTQLGGSGEKIQLYQSAQSVFTMEKVPQDMDFKPYPPVASDYLFQVTAESGASAEESDFLDPFDIEIPQIVKAGFINNNKLFELNWTVVNNIDGYSIQFIDSDGVNIYGGPTLMPDESGVTINTLVGNWYNTPEAGQVYKVRVIAFAYETGADETNFVYNFSDVAIGETEITWAN